MSLIKTHNIFQHETLFTITNPSTTLSNYSSSVEPINFHENRGSCPIHGESSTKGYNIGSKICIVGRKHGQVHNFITMHSFK